MKHKILTIAGIVLGLAVVAIIGLLIGSNGKLFQGALYNLHPVYRQCRIEGQNFNQNNTDDCEDFFKRLEESKTSKKEFLKDGEYTVFTQYTDPQLPENIIPIRIKNNQLECTYLESGYKPQISVTDPNNPLASELIDSPKEIPVGSNGLILKINFLKNNQTLPYDDNICEAAFQGKISDTNKKELGTVKLDKNGFINSRALVNELMISDAPYYNLNQKDFDPGNIYLNLNIAPEISFKFSVPCTSKTPVVEIPNISTKDNALIKIKGLTPEYLKSCGEKLYWSAQNTNNAEDLHQINLDTRDQQTYLLNLRDIPTVAEKNTKFPVSFLLKLHIKNRSDEQEIKTLGTGIFTVTGYDPNKISTVSLDNPIPAPKKDKSTSLPVLKSASSDPSTTITNPIIINPALTNPTTPTTPSKPKVKVKKAEVPIIIVEIASLPEHPIGKLKQNILQP